MTQSIIIFINVHEIKRDYFILNNKNNKNKNNVLSEIRYLGFDSKQYVLKGYINKGVSINECYTKDDNNSKEDLENYNERTNSQNEINHI